MKGRRYSCGLRKTIWLLLSHPKAVDVHIRITLVFFLNILQIKKDFVFLSSNESEFKHYHFAPLVWKKKRSSNTPGMYGDFKKILAHVGSMRSCWKWRNLKCPFKIISVGLLRSTNSPLPPLALHRCLSAAGSSHAHCSNYICHIVSVCSQKLILQAVMQRTSANSCSPPPYTHLPTHIPIPISVAHRSLLACEEIFNIWSQILLPYCVISTWDTSFTTTHKYSVGYFLIYYIYVNNW